MTSTTPEGVGDPGDLTGLLNDLRRRAPAATEVLIPRVYEQLRAMAEHQMRSQPPGHTLQATALIHEVYLKLFDPARLDWNDRGHFFALAARAMRSLLVDHARARKRLKRGEGQRPVTLDEAIAPGTDLDADVLDVHAALEELAALDPRQARVVELRYFGGMEMAEIAALLETSLSTVEREWRSARAWLGARLARGGDV